MRTERERQLRTERERQLRTERETVEDRSQTVAGSCAH